MGGVEAAGGGGLTLRGQQVVVGVGYWFARFSEENVSPVGHVGGDDGHLLHYSWVVVVGG